MFTEKRLKFSFPTEDLAERVALEAGYFINRLYAKYSSNNHNFMPSNALNIKLEGTKLTVLFYVNDTESFFNELTKTEMYKFKAEVGSVVKSLLAIESHMPNNIEIMSDNNTLDMSDLSLHVR